MAIRRRVLSEGVACSQTRTKVQRPSEQITELLQSWSQGDQSAAEKLAPLVYDELHRLARRYMSDERPGHTLQTTALVNEAYLRLVDSSQTTWEGRTHFFGVCAQVMRRILVDWARSRKALKRGGDVLQALAAIDPRKSQVVELRFFGGLNMRETAQVLNVSVETVQRDWKLAKSWLQRELSGDSPR